MMTMSTKSGSNCSGWEIFEMVVGTIALLGVVTAVVSVVAIVVVMTETGNDPPAWLVFLVPGGVLLGFFVFVLGARVVQAYAPLSHLHK